MVAKGLGGKVAVIDTERGSASLYSDLFEFDALDLEPPYTPERYREAIAAAESAGYDVLIIDSASHEWNGQGGCIEINEQVAQAKYKGNTWSAWNETTPRHRKFIDAMLHSKMHIICTSRSKTETVQQDRKVIKLGMKPEQRDGFEYEFTVVLDLVHDGHFATPSKDRTGLFAGDARPIDETTGQKLLAWLENGAPEVKQHEPDYDALCAVLADSIHEIREGIKNDDLWKASAAWFELKPEEKEAIWKSTKNGGAFSTQERAVIKSTEFRKAYYPDQEEAANG